MHEKKYFGKINSSVRTTD